MNRTALHRTLPSAVALSLVLAACGVNRGPTPVDGSVPPVDGSVTDAGDTDAATPLDAGPTPCESAGVTETVACGHCGTVDRFCAASLVWEYGTCADEGVCDPGESRSSTCGMCGTQAETCSATCAWEPVDGCAGEGTCAPGGSSRSAEGCPAGQTQAVLCSDACAYEPAGVCEGDTCPTPGATESVACGMCGMTTRFCNAGHTWDYGTCGGEGACLPGTTGAVPCGRCGTRAARCDTMCAWDTSGAACTGEGTCTPGETSRTDAGCPAGQTRILTCDATCTFAAGTCEIDECTPGATEPAVCGMCGTRTRTCSAMRRWVDGACAGEGVCMPGTSGSTNCGNCGTRPVLCNTACAYIPSGTCAGEGPCAAGTSTPCATTCGSTGTQACSTTCTSGACVPPVETCNGADDDCDGVVDEGCATCTPCAGSTPVTGTGGRYALMLGPGTRTGSCGGAGAEGLLSLTLTETSDVFVSTHGAGIDTVLYARRCNCSGTEVACADDSDGRLTSVLRLTALPAGNYTIVVDSESVASRSISVDAYITPTAVQGDRCGNPRAIAAGATRLTGNTCGLHADYATPGGTCITSAAGGAEDAVYYFYVPTASTVTFNGCNEGFSFDGTLYIRSVCNDAAVANEVACDDDACGPGTGTCTALGYGPSASVPLAAGLYYLFVDGYVMSGTPTCARCGPFDITVSGL